MTLRFIDGAGGYNTAQAEALRTKWTTWSSGVTVDATGGRRGGPSIRLSNWNQRFTCLPIDNLNPQSTFIIGFAYKVAALPVSGPRCIVRIRELAGDQCCIALTTTGTIEAHTGDQTGALLGTSSAVLTAGVYCYLEVKFVIHDTLGSVEVRKDGATILNVTNVDTSVFGGNYGNYVGFCIATHSSEAATIDYDDIYICDASGILNNTFQGDLRVDSVFPNGAGNHSEWTPSTGSNYQNVDDNPANDDTDYNFSGLLTAKDTYAFPDIPPTVGNVVGISHNMTVRKDDALTHTFRDIARFSGANYNSGPFTLTNSYKMYSNIRETQPGGGPLWTIANLNATEFGVELVS